MMKVSHDVVVRIRVWSFLLSLDAKSRPPPNEAATETKGGLLLWETVIVGIPTLICALLRPLSFG